MPHTIIDATPGDLVVTALDFDGCIQRTKPHIETKTQYLEEQADLLTFLDANQTNVILSGSSRTTPELDWQNSRNHHGLWAGASFNVFPWLADDAKNRLFNPFLLNDLWATHQDGTPFELGDSIESVKAFYKTDLWENSIIKDKRKEEKQNRPYEEEDPFEESHDDEIWMRDKINIIYAQIHYLAHAYPNKKITYQLVDDIPDYLFAMSYFYQAHPDLVPQNISIQHIHHNCHSPKFSYIHTQSTLHHVSNLGFVKNEVSKAEYQLYDYEEISAEDKDKVTIKGIGITDPSYKESVKCLSTREHNPGGYTLDDRHYYASTINVDSFLAARNSLIAEHETKEAEKTQALLAVAETMTKGVIASALEESTRLISSGKATFFKPANPIDTEGKKPTPEGTPEARQAANPG